MPSGTSPLVASLGPLAEKFYAGLPDGDQRAVEGLLDRICADPFANNMESYFVASMPGAGRVYHLCVFKGDDFWIGYELPVPQATELDIYNIDRPDTFDHRQGVPG